MSVSPLVVFDLDGTLVDSAPDLINALNFVLAREGLPPVPVGSARKLVGAGARALIERALEAEGRSLPPDRVDVLTRDLVDFYAEHIADETRPFEGTEAVLDHLAAQGFRLAVCTNKLEWLSKRLLDRLGLSDRFAAICGADTFGISKPDPVFLRETIVKSGGDPKAAIMVGDSGPDVGVARRASVPVIGVSFGYSTVPIEELEPDLVINHMSELPTAVARLREKTPINI
jgi:phosphoglycolate phosphatase